MGISLFFCVCILRKVLTHPGGATLPNTLIGVPLIHLIIITVPITCTCCGLYFLRGAEESQNKAPPAYQVFVLTSESACSEALPICHLSSATG